MTCDQGQEVSLNRISGESTCTWMLSQAMWFRIAKLILWIFLYIPGNYLAVVVNDKDCCLEIGITIIFWNLELSLWCIIGLEYIPPLWQTGEVSFSCCQCMFYGFYILKCLELWYCIDQFTILSKWKIFADTSAHVPWVWWPPWQVHLDALVTSTCDYIRSYQSELASCFVPPLGTPVNRDCLDSSTPLSAV